MIHFLKTCSCNSAHEKLNFCITKNTLINQVLYTYFFFKNGQLKTDHRKKVVILSISCNNWHWSKTIIIWMQMLLLDIYHTYMHSTWFTVYFKYFEYFSNLSKIDYLNNSLHLLGLLLWGLFLFGRELRLFLLFLGLLLLLCLFSKPSSSFLPVKETLITYIIKNCMLKNFMTWKVFWKLTWCPWDTCIVTFF